MRIKYLSLFWVVLMPLCGAFWWLGIISPPPYSLTATFMLVIWMYAAEDALEVILEWMKRS